MDRLHSSNMLDIFSRVPAKCLARSRCVSKVWCEYIDDRYLTTVHDKQVIEEPTPILYHTRLSQDGKFRSLCFHVIAKQTETGIPFTYVLEPKEYPFLEFLRKKPPKKSSDVRIEVRGSCNGLMCLSQDEVPCSESHDSCGLGFDASTNTLKMVCVLFKDRPPRGGDLDMLRKNLCTMVHVLGTNSWREIPQVLPYYIMGRVVYANGFLNWYDQLVDLNGEVGYVCVGTMEVWLLNDKKEWVPHCRIKREILPNGYVEILGCWNKDRDMLIKNLANNERRMTNTIVTTPVNKMFFYLITLNLARFLNETAPQVEPPKEGKLSNAQAVQAVEAWKHSDFLCHNYVLNGLVDSLYNVYCKTTTAKEL
ncbi:F-box domain containing protein [Tanacetum coccineum]